MFTPRKWAYEPLSQVRSRALSEFDKLRDVVSPLVAAGDGLSLHKAKQAVEDAKTSEEEKQKRRKSWMLRVGDAAREALNKQQEIAQRQGNTPAELQPAIDLENAARAAGTRINRPGVLPGGAAAFPEEATGRRVYQPTAQGPSGGHILGQVGEAFDTARGAVVGGLSNPSNPLQGIQQGAEHPEQTSARAIGPIRHFATHVAEPNLGVGNAGGASVLNRIGGPQGVATAAGNILLDPFTYVGGKTAESGGRALGVAERVRSALGTSAEERTGAAVKELDPLAARIGEAVKNKYRPNGLALEGGAPAMSPTIKGTKGAVPLGDSGIADAIASKAQALHRPDNPVLGAEGSTRRKIVGSIVNPSAAMPQEVHVANNARIGVQNSLYTDFFSSERAAAKEVKAAFAEHPPTYIGKGKSPIAGTAVDYLERPSVYADVSPRLQAAKDAWGQAQLDNLNRVRGQYNGKTLEPYVARDPGGVYVPHVEANIDFDSAIQSTSKSLSSRPGITRTRSAPSLFSATSSHPEFIPETDLEKLADYHSNALASIAANNTFMEGVGGLKHAQLVEKFEPKTFAKMTLLKQRLQNLRASTGRLDAKTADAVDQFLGSQQSPDDLQALLDGIEPTVSRGANKGQNLPGVNAEIAKVRAQIKRLRPAWENADTGNYVRSPDTFLYHTPEQAKAINSVLKTKINNAFIEGAFQAADELRGVALGPDFSPMTIQGALGAASHPEVLIKDGARMAQVAFGGQDALMKAVDPEVVRRYEFSTGRKFGNLGREFRQEGQGLERIPGVGRAVGGFNDAMQRVTEFANLKAWENDSKILQAFGHPQNIADHEAANSISKFIPRLNPAETGRSVQRARLERLPIISTSFRYAPPLIAKDITTATGKLAIAAAKHGGNPKAAWQALDGREQLALIRGAALASTLSTVSIASAVASANANGKNPADAVKDVMNPMNSHFMSLILGDKGSIGLGGPIRSSIRALAPGYVNGKPVPFARVLNFARSSTNPALGASIDLLRNKDYFGNTIVKGEFPENFARALEYGLENMNLVAGAPLSDIRTGVGNPLVDTISQIGGTNFTETSPTEKLNEIARQRFNGDFYDLEPSQQDVIKKANPDLWNAAVQRGSPKRQEAQQVKTEIQQKQTARDDALMSGQIKREDWVNAYYDSLSEKRAKLEQIYGSDPITKPKNGVEHYIQILQQAEDPQTGILDRDKVDAGMATLTKDEQAYIDRNIGLDDTPTAKVFRDVRQIRSDRFQLPKYRGYTAEEAQDIDDTWQEVRNNARSADKLDMLRALRIYRQSNDIDPHVYRGIYARITGTLRQDRARKEYDKFNPEQDLFYGNGTLTQRDQAMLDFLVKQKEAA